MKIKGRNEVQHTGRKAKKWVMCSRRVEAWKNERGRKNKPAGTHANLRFLKESPFRKAWEEKCHFTSIYLQLNFNVPTLTHILIYDRGKAKSNNEKMLIVTRQVFFLISYSYLFLQQTLFSKTLDSGSTVWGKNSYSIFWLQAQGMNKNCNCKRFPMEVLQELCSISPLLQLHDPTERKTDEISRRSRLLQALNSPKPCEGLPGKGTLGAW